jgi:PPOX class probable F420-dependent enzyme
MRLDPRQARALLASAHIARLASVRPDGAPHLVPVCFALAGGAIYTAVDAKPKRTRSLARLANIAGDPRVSLLADHYEDDWTRLWWVRVDGDAAVVTDPSERERALSALAARYRQYAAERPSGAVIAIAPRRWTGWRS